MKHTITQLEDIARRARSTLIAGEVGLSLGVLLASVVCCAALDWWLRFPTAVRIGMLVALIVLAWHLARQHICPAFRFRPTALDVAFRMERRAPQLQGKLASAVEFASAARASTSDASSEQRLQAELARGVVAEVEQSTAMSLLDGAIRYGPSLQRGLLLCITLVLLFVTSLLTPEFLRIGASRILLPWSASRWPARTEVHSLLGRELIHARGVPLALRAELVKGDAEDERIWASYRVKQATDSIWGGWNEVLLARQPNGIYERLLELDGTEIELRFVSSEDESDPTHITLVESPALVSASFIAEPPAYLQAHNIKLDAISQSLGDGTDARAVVLDPVLEGSTVRISAQLNAPAEVSLAGTEGFEGTVFIEDSTPTSVLMDGVATGAAKIHVKLHDQHGLENRTDIGFVFDTIPDRAPTAAVTDPSNDESFVADAVLPLRGELRDDFGLARVGFEFTVRSRGATDTTSETPLREEIKLAQGVMAEESQILALSSFNVDAGDTILVRAVAEDIFERDGKHHDRVRSAPRALRIVSAEDFEQQLRAALASVRRDAMRTDELQARAQERLAGATASSDETKSVTQAQAEVSESLARHASALAAVERRMQRNKKGDTEIANLAREAATISREAQTSSEEAAQHVKDVEQALGGEVAIQESHTQAARAQEEVRADMESLVALLDRDADSWLSKRRIQELRERIEQLTRETDALAQRTQAKAREELSPEDRAALDALAVQQQAAADDAEALVSELQERQEATKQADPALARALEQAAKAARDGRVREKMEQASDATKSNQLTQAKASEQSAAQALAQAEQALKDVGKIRAEELARVLETLVESVQRLIQQTESVLPKFSAPGDTEPTARAVGQLSQNTRALAGDARGSGRAASKIAPHLDRAAESLSAATELLRRETPATVDAAAAGESALVSFKEALVLAEEAKERAQQDAATEKREELLAKYRTLLEREVALKVLTETVVATPEKPLTRREQVELRRLSVAQSQVRDAVHVLLQEEEAVAKSEAFSDVHDEIDRSLAAAVDALNRAQPTEALSAQSDGVQGLADLIAALGQDEDEDPFEERQSPQSETGGGGGGSQPSDPIPPLAELRLLRQMQRQLLQRTLQLDAAREAGLSTQETDSQRANLAAKQARIVELAEKLAQSMEKSKGTPTDEKPTETPEVNPSPPSVVPSTHGGCGDAWRLLWLA